MGKLQRLHDGVQTVVATAGDGDTGDIAFVILDRTEEKIPGQAQETQVGTPTGIPAASAFVSGCPGYHSQLCIPAGDLTLESLHIFAIDLLQALFNCIH